MKNYRKSSHTIFDIKYHICWITKYRYQILHGEIGKRVRELIRLECKKLDVQIITGSVGSDHIHLFLSVPPKVAISKLVQQCKGPISLKIQREFPELRKRYWGKHLWARGYFVVSSGNVTDEMWMEYIRNQREAEQNEKEKDLKIQQELQEDKDFQVTNI